MADESLEILRQMLQAERARNDALEEELDLLALDNERLRGLVARYEGTAPPEVSVPSLPEPEVILMTGQDTPANMAARLRIENATAGSNVVCVALVRLDDGTILVLCGGANKLVNVFQLAADNVSYTLVCSEEMLGPPLTIDVSGNLVLISLMDGAVALRSIVVSSSSSGGIELDRVLDVKDHTKPVVSARFDDTGNTFATASYDKCVTIYKRGAGSSFTKTAVIRLHTAPECLVFVDAMQSAGSGVCANDEGLHVETLDVETCRCEQELVIGLREVTYLLYLNCTSYTSRKISLNESKWNTHVSFTPLFLTVSPNKRQLLVATSNNFHFISRIGESSRLNILSAHNCSEYGKPRVCWENSGEFVFSNSEKDRSIYVYSAITGKYVCELSGPNGHTKEVRDLAILSTSVTDDSSSSSLCLLASASFDKSVILWSR